MENILNFIYDNYVWIITFTIILLFSLIGYLYDSRKEKKDLLRRQENEINEESIKNMVINSEKSLNDVVNTSKNINPETKAVELTDNTILDNQKEVEEKIEQEIKS